jgi:hypothetical protein
MSDYLTYDLFCVTLNTKLLHTVRFDLHDVLSRQIFAHLYASPIRGSLAFLERFHVFV